MKPYYERSGISLHCGDCADVLAMLPDASVQTCVTSPPYFGLRDYGVAGQIGLEATPDAYVARLVAVFRAVRRVLRDDGTLWLNLGDSYAANRSYQVRDNKHTEVGNDMPMRVPEGYKSKDLLGIPWLVAFALRADGWYLRSDIVWHKPNPMPESVTDRPTRSHEYIFLLTKSARYYYDADAIAEPILDPLKSRHTSGDGQKRAPTDRVAGIRNGGRIYHTRNKRDVWSVNPMPYAEAHFATFPPKLIEPCILAGAPAGGVVLDPFAGAGTTLMVAKNLGRRAIGIELNEQYAGLIVDRLRQDVLALEAVV